MISHEPDKPELHLVTDASLEPLDLIRRVELAMCHGIDVVQLRLPGGTARQIYEVAAELRALLENTSIRLVINDRVDVALAVSAAGAHLGHRSIPVQIARSILSSDACVGASVQTIEEARLAEAQGASYVTFGHVYETQSHPGESPRGVEQLSEVVRSVHIPVVAIGGITAETIPKVLATGARGIAVMSGILRSDDVASSTGALRSALDSLSERTSQ